MSFRSLASARGIDKISKASIGIDILLVEPAQYVILRIDSKSEFEALQGTTLIRDNAVLIASSFIPATFAAKVLKT